MGYTDTYTSYQIQIRHELAIFILARFVYVRNLQLIFIRLALSPDEDPKSYTTTLLLSSFFFFYIVVDCFLFSFFLYPLMEMASVDVLRHTRKRTKTREKEMWFRIWCCRYILYDFFFPSFYVAFFIVIWYRRHLLTRLYIFVAL